VDELPPPLPPETRTVGQLVAESIRLYSRRFWPSLALGVGPALVAVVQSPLGLAWRLVVLVTVGGAVLTASFVGATAIAAELRPDRRALGTALLGGMLAFAPFPVLASFLLLPGVAWLALVGLVVPVALIERRPLLDSFRRAAALARADYVHAAGSLATLALVALLTSFVLFFLLRDQADAALVAAGFLAILVISPLLFLGAALLYFDQEARLRVERQPVRSRRQRPRRRADADLHHAHEPHRAGAADAEVQP
jgi:hypothetical protein